MVKPTLLQTILKDMSKSKLQAFLLRKDSQHFNTVLMTPISRCYYDVANVMKNLLVREARLRGNLIILTDELGYTVFPQIGQVINYYINGKNTDFLSLLKREGLLDKISYLAIGPKALVSTFREEFTPRSLGKDRLSSFLTTWVVKPTVMSKYLSTLNYFKSKGVFSKGPLLTPKQIRKKMSRVKVSKSK